MNQTSGESAVGKLKTKTANISRLLRSVLALQAYVLQLRYVNFILAATVAHKICWRAKTSPILITHTRKLLHLMYIAYVCSNTSSICSCEASCA